MAAAVLAVEGFRVAESGQGSGFRIFGFQMFGS